MKKIIVCSKNKAKNEAVNKVMKDYFTSEFEIISLETESGVSETPNSDEEGIKGCHNRISSALNQNNDGDFYVAMEGILAPNSYGSFLCGWTVVYDKNADKYYYGCSAKIKVPEEILKTTNKDERLSQAVANYVGNTDEEVSKFGTNGILTNGAYTRCDEFTDSVMCAIYSRLK